MGRKEKAGRLSGLIFFPQYASNLRYSAPSRRFESNRSKKIDSFPCVRFSRSRGVQETEVFVSFDALAGEGTFLKSGPSQAGLAAVAIRHLVSDLSMDMTLTVPPSAMAEDTDLATRTVNTLRFLAVDAVQRANSGHPGMPMGAASMAYVAWRYHITQDPSNLTWPNRDRFVLSAGHGSMLLYGLLHLSGYPISLDDIKQFRQWGSKTPGHPEFDRQIGIETTTGPLGQGFANGVGMAIAERWLAERFNRPGYNVVNHHTFAIVSDGDLMEGVSHEAASLAGHLGLGKLVYLYDDNRITIDGSTDLSCSDDVEKRFESYGWQVIQVDDGNDRDAVDQAIVSGKSESNRPTLIMVRTNIGYGSPNKQDTSSVHGAPLGEEEVLLTKGALGWPTNPGFLVPDDVVAHMREIIEIGTSAREKWEELMSDYAAEHPELAGEWTRFMNGDTVEGWDGELPTFEPGSAIATRAASGKFLQAVDTLIPNLLGGSADLAASNNTYLESRGDFSSANPGGGNIHFGIREHAMASIANGLVLHGGIRPYCATFLVFSDYMRPAIRLGALMGLPVTYVFTHDSIGLGEDGPTHQPVEHLMALRTIPNVTVIRPSDGNETVEAWKVALAAKDGPVLVILSRQKLKNRDLDESIGVNRVSKGGYVVRDSDGAADLILIATGSEVQLALDAAAELINEGIATRVVSMPSWELFEQQTETYREDVLPSEISARLSIEAGVTTGWERYVGSKGAMIGMNGFGESAPADVLFEQFGFSVAHIKEEAQKLLGRN
ncbi:MAG: transketolase [Rhodothermia bacterium]|nr:MAG: transketolase [Rhodothermia bacterium]